MHNTNDVNRDAIKSEKEKYTRPVQPAPPIHGVGGGGGGVPNEVASPSPAQFFAE